MKTIEVIDVAALDGLAERITAKLQGSVISSVLPVHVGDWLREAAREGQRWQQSQLYLAGANCLLTRWLINPDGTLELGLDGPDGSLIWRGVFRPAEVPRA